MADTEPTATTPITFREYGETVIRERIQRLASLSAPVRKAEDIEAVHDMRVASRRLRAALAVFEPAFACPAYAALVREVRTITRALGAARDLDVMIQTLERLDLTIPKRQRAGLEAFIEEQRARREDAQRDVIRALDRFERASVAESFERIAAGETTSPRRRNGGEVPPEDQGLPALAVVRTENGVATRA